MLGSLPQTLWKRILNRQVQLMKTVGHEQKFVYGHGSSIFSVPQPQFLMGQNPENHRWVKLVKFTQSFIEFSALGKKGQGNLAKVEIKSFKTQQFFCLFFLFISIYLLRLLLKTLSQAVSQILHFPMYLGNFLYFSYTVL